MAGAECAGINRRGVVNERVTRERSSEPFRPRVVRGQPQGYHRSVDRGTCRQGIELRNNRDQSADVVQHGGRQYRQRRHRESPQDAAQSKTPGMYGNSTRENRETLSTPAGEDAAGRLEKALSQKSNMHVDGDSDGRVVPAKCPNKGEQAPAEGNGGKAIDQGERPAA